MTIKNQSNHSGRCLVHSRKLRHHSCPRYIGFYIPVEISRPIRAGLLLGVERVPLYNLIVDLMNSNPMPYPNQYDSIFKLLGDHLEPPCFRRRGRQVRRNFHCHVRRIFCSGPGRQLFLGNGVTVCKPREADSHGRTIRPWCVSAPFGI